MKTLAYYTEQTKFPGKFEGASPLTVFLYDASMDGDGEPIADIETDGHFAYEFQLTGSEREHFQTEERDWVLTEDRQGFVNAIPASEYAKWAGRV